MLQFFPTNRNFGGDNDFSQDTLCVISHKGAALKEYLICLTTLMGKRFAFSGGGFFMVLPYWYVLRAMQLRDYNICYFHLNDLIIQKFAFKSKAEYEEYFREPGNLKNCLVRYIKMIIGHGDAFEKLK